MTCITRLSRTNVFDTIASKWANLLNTHSWLRTVQTPTSMLHLNNDQKKKKKMILLPTPLKTRLTKCLENMKFKLYFQMSHNFRLLFNIMSQVYIFAFRKVTALTFWMVFKASISRCIHVDVHHNLFNRSSILVALLHIHVVCLSLWSTPPRQTWMTLAWKMFTGWKQSTVPIDHYACWSQHNKEIMNVSTGLPWERPRSLSSALPFSLYLL